MIEVKGKPVDDQTRCVHYHSELDVIAIRFKCCNVYYPCYYCHAEAVGHTAEVWPKNEFSAKAVLCGVCKQEMSIEEYHNSHYQCPSCKAPFNPRCSNHNHLYFEV